MDTRIEKSKRRVLVGGLLDLVPVRHRRMPHMISFLITLGIACAPSFADYSGGTGTPEDPYQIATAIDLLDLGSEPNDYDKHFTLTADIDLCEYTFKRAVIAADTDPNTAGFNGIAFSGSFDGNDHVIRNLHIQGGEYLGLFGQLVSGTEISNLGLEAVDVYGTGGYIGGLAGYSLASITNCYSTGNVTGNERYVGGLVGENVGEKWVFSFIGRIATCYSTVTVTGVDNVSVGGLVGGNRYGIITTCYSTGNVTGDWGVGGLVGGNSDGDITTCYSTGNVTGKGWNVGGLAGGNGGLDFGNITACYSTGNVSGWKRVGGLVAFNGNNGNITACYSTGDVKGATFVGGLAGDNSGNLTRSYSTGAVTGSSVVGGLVGWNHRNFSASYSTGVVTGLTFVGGLVGNSEAGITLTTSFWDIESSGQSTSAGGTGLTTVEMQDINTFLDAGWDFIDDTANGTADIWRIADKAYPILWWELSARIIYVDDDAHFDPGPNDSSVSDPEEDGSKEHPFDEIQEGIDDAYHGDTVVILSGTYDGTIDLMGKATVSLAFNR